MAFVIHDLKYDTYYAGGTQRGRDGNPAPAWTDYRGYAKIFHSIGEVKAVMYRLKKIRNQDNHAIIYERW